MSSTLVFPVLPTGEDNSASDEPVDLTDPVATLRDANAAANDDVAVSPGGFVGNGFDAIVFDNALIGETITLTEGRLHRPRSVTAAADAADDQGPGCRSR